MTIENNYIDEPLNNLKEKMFLGNEEEGEEGCLSSLATALFAVVLITTVIIFFFL